MSKFKVGDKVRVLPRLEGQRNQGPAYVDVMLVYAGKEFVIQEIRTTDGDIELDGSWYVWHEDWLELVDRPFTQQDLEIGMLVEHDNGYIGSMDSDYVLGIMLKRKDVVAIYKPTETGFERVWTKPKPKLYTLELPGIEDVYCKFYNECKEDDSYFFESSTDTDDFKTQFTEEEIENLPNQDLIKVLIKKEVVK